MAPLERDPERPDPAEASCERIRETLVERQIRAAMDEGAFDDLPHQGRRLPLEDDALSGDRALAHRMLRNAGFAPAWIEADKIARAELVALQKLIDRGRPRRTDRARARAPRGGAPRGGSEPGDRPIERGGPDRSTASPTARPRWRARAVRTSAAR